MLGLISIRHACLLVFATAFIEFSGVPVAASLVLLGVGAATLQASNPLHVLALAGAAGATAADTIWYLVGRLRGRRLTRVYCAATLSTHDCTARTERFFRRLGPRALVVAKFVPGLASLASPFAGIARTPVRVFWTWDLLGSLLWSAAFLSTGRAAGQRVVDAWGHRVASFGPWMWGAIAALAASWIVAKFLRRRRLGTARLEPDKA